MTQDPRLIHADYSEHFTIDWTGICMGKGYHRYTMLNLRCK